MKYLMFVCTDPEPEDDEPTSIEQWAADVDSRGKRIIGDRVRPVADATSVRVRKGELLLSDGPYTEGKDWIAGFDILDCDDLDEAVAIAAQHPMAHHGRLELRPFWPLDDED